MNIIQALGQVAGRPDMFLVRQTGEIVRVTKNFGLRDCRSGREHAWVPSYGALVTDDWMVIDAAKLAAMVQKQAEARQP